MRKDILIILSLALIFTAAGCGKKKQHPEKSGGVSENAVKSPESCAPSKLSSNAPVSRTVSQQEPTVKIVNSPPCETVATIPAPPVPTPTATTSAVKTESFTPVADTTIHRYPKERNFSSGGRSYMRAKGAEDAALIRFDLSKLKGRKIKKATLYVQTRGNDRLRYVGVSTVTVPWVEGTATQFGKDPAVPNDPGSATFYTPGNGDKNSPQPAWTAPSSTFYSASFGMGGSFWYRSEAESAKKDGWQKIAVHPDIIYALANGDADSMALYDVSGQTRTAKAFSSREQNNGQPELKIEYEDIADTTPPGAPTDLTFSTEDLYHNELILRFKPAADIGFSDTAFGYEVYWSDSPITNVSESTKVVRWRIPHYPQADGKYFVLMQDLPPGKTIYVAVRAYDAAGNIGPAAVAKVTLPKYPIRGLAESGLPPMGKPSRAAGVVTVGGISIFAVPGTVRIDPVSGDVDPAPKTDPRNGNSVWNAAKRSVVLFGAREEVIDFQLALTTRSAVSGITVTLSDLTGDAGGTITAQNHIKLFKVWSIHANDGKKTTWVPEVCVPISGTVSIPMKGNGISNQKAISIWTDIYIPADTPSGNYTGAITVSAGGASAAIPVNVTVLPFTLPSIPTFQNELNCYSRTVSRGKTIDKLGGPEKADMMVRQTARWERSVVNVLPYNQGGKPANDYSVPVVSGEGKDATITDWSKFDAYYGPILSGSAFTPKNGYTGPGEGEPEPVCYLPVHENWPANIKKYYRFSASTDNAMHEHGRAGPPLEIAFDDVYWDTWNTVNRQFLAGLLKRGWTQTHLQFFLNNKVSRKNNGGSGSSWWLLDEPQQTVDYYALGFFARKFRAIADDTMFQPLKIEYRGDVSRMKLTFGLLDNAMDLLIASRDVKEAPYLMRERKLSIAGEAHGRYGGGISITSPIMQLEASLIDTWMAGIDYALPYYTSFAFHNWDALTWADPAKKNDRRYQLSLIYPPGPTGYLGPMASVRLKAERRAVQEIEYMYMLSGSAGWNRELVRRAVAGSLNLNGKIDQKNYEDPGLITFTGIGMDTLPVLRARLAASLLKLKTVGRYPVEKTYGHAPTRALVQGRWTEEPISIREYHARQKELNNALTLTIAGKSAVSDCGIRSDKPDATDNSGVFKITARHGKDIPNGMLIKFDLKDLPKDKEIFSASLIVKVWDTPSKAPSKLGAFRILSADWVDGQATWNAPKKGGSWKKSTFTLKADTAFESGGSGVCPKDLPGKDVNNPPIPVKIDILNIVKAWQAGKPNHGLIVIGIPDRSVDDGYGVRCQIRTSDNGDGAEGPELQIQYKR